MGAAAQRPARLILPAALLAAVTMAAGCAAGEPMVTIPRNHSSDAAEWTSRAPKDFQLQPNVAFRLRNRAESEKFSEELQDPRSPNYHHWLKKGEFEARWGRTPAEVKAVSDWLSGEGFQIVAADPLRIKMMGTVATAEKAFAITIMTSADKSLYANSTDPQIPARFAGVILGIFGLDNETKIAPVGMPLRIPGTPASPTPPAP